MLKKTLIAAAALAAVGFAASAPANAKVNVDLYFGGGGWGPGYYGYYQPRPYYNHRYHGYRPVYVQPRHWGISCGQGRNTVDWSGYNNVKTIECQGASYTYRATRHGKAYVVKVGRNSGNIIDVNRIR
jgi:hypothetical protein